MHAVLCRRYFMMGVAAILMFCMTPVAADDGPYLQALADQAVDNVRQRTDDLAAKFAAQRGPSFNQQMEAARTAFWDAYASGEDTTEAEAEYAKLLATKDIILMVMAFADEASRVARKQLVPDRQEAGDTLADLARRAVMLETDGGIRPDAVSEFRAWYEAIDRRRTKAPAVVDAITAVPTAADAMAESIKAGDPEVAAYVAARNRAEKKAALHKLPFASDREYLLELLRLTWGPDKDVAAWHAQREALAGKDMMQDLAALLRSAPKDRNGNLSTPAFVDDQGKALILTLEERIDRFIGNGSAQLYAIWQIRLNMEVDWATARELYQTYWVGQFGEAVVLEAAEKVRSARKRVGPLRELLVDKIADDSGPQYALIKLMPHNPYRDWPLGSLESTEPEKFLLALVKENDSGVQYWSDVPGRLAEMKAEWGEENLLRQAQQLIAATKDSQGNLTSPAELGIAASKPWDAFHELLKKAQAHEPDLFFGRLLQAEGWTWGPDFHMSSAGREYQRLADAFGRTRVDEVIKQVREAEAAGKDLATLPDAVSGFKTPVAVIYDILWATAPPEACLKELDPTENGIRTIWTQKYGREMVHDAVRLLQKSRKLWELVQQIDNGRRGMLLVDRASAGLPPKEPKRGPRIRQIQNEPRLMRQCLPEIFAQLQAQKDAIPLEVGQALQLKNSRRPHYVKIVRRFDGDDGHWYLLDHGNTHGWTPHAHLRRDWQPVESSNLPFNRPRAGGPEVPNDWPEGTEVMVTVDGQTRKGKVLFFEGRSNPPKWAVEYEILADDQRSTRKLLFSRNSIKSMPRFAIGQKVGVRVSGRELEATVVEHRTSGANYQYRLEYEWMGRPESRRWFTENLVRPLD